MSRTVSLCAQLAACASVQLRIGAAARLHITLVAQLAGTWLREEGRS